MSNSLCVITTYFNPCHYESRRRNYDLFVAGIRAAGVPLITVECAFGDQPFELPAGPEVIRVRARSLLWQKERLLNLAASWLPASCKYVAWLDCDILFRNADWSGELVDVLEQYKVAQVFESCVRLEQGNVRLAAPDRAFSFASVMAKSPESMDEQRYDRHGHTGYGWAMRREIFDMVGLYEAAVSGSADHFMAHAIFNKYNFCITNALKQNHAQISHLKAWGRRFYSMVEGSLGCVSGEIEHLWHGDATDRRYFLRMHEITDLGFNPWTDIVTPAGAPLEWSPSMDKPGLEKYFATYFASRREDGLQLEREAA
jgi:hypothetical protein